MKRTVGQSASEKKKNVLNVIDVYMPTNVLMDKLEHSLDIVRKSDMHSYNDILATKIPYKTPQNTIKYKRGKRRLRYHCLTTLMNQIEL